MRQFLRNSLESKKSQENVRCSSLLYFIMFKTGLLISDITVLLQSLLKYIHENQLQYYIIKTYLIVKNMIIIHILHFKKSGFSDIFQGKSDKKTLRIHKKFSKLKF